MNSLLRAVLLLTVLGLATALMLLTRAAWLSTQEPEAGTVVLGSEEILSHLLDSGPRAGESAKTSAIEPKPGRANAVDWQEALESLHRARSAVASELLLQFDSGEAMRRFMAAAGKQGLRMVSSREALKLLRVGFAGKTAELAQLLREQEGIKALSPNHLIWVPGIGTSPQPDPNNAGGEAAVGERALSMIGAAADRRHWGLGVKVAVLDTGILPHPSLNGVSVQHQDFVRDGQPWHGHGTAMASLIAGRDAEDPDYGIAQGAELLDVRVANGKGVGNTAEVAEGVLWAVDQGARVINISLGSNGDSPWLAQAVAHAQSRGVIVVASAGNERAAQLDYPAAYPGVLSVGAVDAQGVQAYFSNSGQGLFLSAPGVAVPSAYDRDRRVLGSGTSQAAAMVSAAAAVLIARGVRPEQVASVLASSATATGAPSTQVGAGVLWLGK